MQVVLNDTIVGNYRRGPRFEDSINRRGLGRMTFIKKDPNFNIQTGEPIEIYDDGVDIQTTDPFFSGIVAKPIETNPLNTTPIEIEVDLLDNTAICGRRVIAETYINQSNGYIVQDIINKYLGAEGITAGTIDDSVTVKRAIYSYMRADDVLDELAELTGCNWWVTPEKVLHFFKQGTFKAPWDLVNQKPIRNVKIESDLNQYRNRQYIRAGQDTTDLQTEEFILDGKQKTFTVAYKIAEKPTITIEYDDGTTKTPSIGIRGVDQNSEWYWNKGEKELGQAQNETAEDGGVLRIEYVGLFPIMVVSEDATAINERKEIEGGTGIYEYVENNASINDSDSALDFAEGKVRRFARISRKITFQTRRDGLRAGQVIDVEFSEHGINGDFLITKVELSEEMEGQKVYDVEMLDGEDVGGWEKFFKKMSDNSNVVSVRENEVLVKIKKSNDEVKSDDTMTIEKAASETRIGYARIGFSEVG